MSNGNYIVDRLRSSHDELSGDEYWQTIYRERDEAADEIERLTTALHDEIRQHQGDADELNRLRAEADSWRANARDSGVEARKYKAERDALIIQKQEIHQIGYEVAAERDSARAEVAALRDDQAIEAYVEDYEFRGDDGDYKPNENERTLIVDALRGWPEFAKDYAALAAKDGDEVSPIFTSADDLIASMKKGGDDDAA